MISSFLTLFILISFLMPGYAMLSVSGTSRRLPDFQLLLKSILGSLFWHLLYTGQYVRRNGDWLLKANEQAQQLIDQGKTLWQAPEKYLQVLSPHEISIVLFLLGFFMLPFALGLVWREVMRHWGWRWGLADRSERTMLHEILETFRKSKTLPLVRVALKDGIIYLGPVVKGSSELYKEILLSDPYMFRSPEAPPESVSGYVYLKLDDVAHIHFYEHHGEHVLAEYVGGGISEPADMGEEQRAPAVSKGRTVQRRRKNKPPDERR